MAIWVVMGMLIVGVVAAVIASRHSRDDVEPSVREFTEFRHAISRQVAGVEAETRSTSSHIDQHAARPTGATERRATDLHAEDTAPHG